MPMPDTILVKREVDPNDPEFAYLIAGEQPDDFGQLEPGAVLAEYRLVRHLKVTVKREVTVEEVPDPAEVPLVFSQDDEPLDVSDLMP